MKRQGRSSPVLRPKHSLGQNFILDERLQAELAEATGLGADDTVLEIGAGTGLFTRALADRAGHVTALEIDRDLIPYLKASLLSRDNVTVLEGDALRFDFSAFAEAHGPFSIAANLPYHITTALLTKLTRQDLPIRSIHLMQQKESAEKFVSGPGDEGYGTLPLRVQWRFTPQIVRVLPPEAFTPAPKVDSAFLGLTRRETPPVRTKDEAFLFRVINAAFAARRKTLLNNLLSAFPFARDELLKYIGQAGLAPTARAEELDIAAFARLSDLMITAAPAKDQAAPDD